MNDLAWFKSSYSGASGGECVEVAYDWRKSSHSGGEGGNCLEVSIRPGAADPADPAAPSVHVRDSKDPDGPALRFRPAEWAAFVAFACGNPLRA